MRQIDFAKSPRFAQVSTYGRLPFTKNLRGVKAAFVGIPFDGGTSYRTGSRFGPRDIRQNSSLIRPYNPVLQVSPFDVLRVADVGDVDVNPINIEDTYGRVEQAVVDVLNAGVVPVCVGGDHSLSLPILRAVNRKHGPVGMPILAEGEPRGAPRLRASTPARRRPSRSDPGSLAPTVPQ